MGAGGLGKASLENRLKSREPCSVGAWQVGMHDELSLLRGAKPGRRFCPKGTAETDV